MKIGNEEVELVTDFASLRAGMIVYSRNCKCCDREWCRAMLWSPSLVLTPGWRTVPNCSPRSNAVVSKGGVDRGVIYRVVDPLLDARPVTRARELAR
jgi:hypothetical protein